MTDASGRRPTTPVPQLSAEPVARRARIWPRSVPARIGRARTSTVVLVVLFVGFFALWVGVRPENTAGESSTPASVVQPVPTTEAPATTTVPPPTSEPTTTPRATSSRPTTTAPTTTDEEEPTTSSSTSERPTSAPSTTRPAPASSTPAPTSADPTD